MRPNNVYEIHDTRNEEDRRANDMGVASAGQLFAAAVVIGCMISGAIVVLLAMCGVFSGQQ